MSPAFRSARSTNSKPPRTPTKPKRTKPSMVDRLPPVLHGGLLSSVPLFLQRVQPLILAAPHQRGLALRQLPPVRAIHSAHKAFSLVNRPSASTMRSSMLGQDLRGCSATPTEPLQVPFAETFNPRGTSFSPWLRFCFGVAIFLPHRCPKRPLFCMQSRRRRNENLPRFRYARASLVQQQVLQRVVPFMK